MTANAKRVVFTMGGKGGVGKTGVMVALAEWFEANEIPVTLLDLDTENKARGSLQHFFNGRATKVNIHTPAGLDALAVIHPENLTPKLQFAIDQFLLAGKPVFLAVDPSSLYFKRQGGQAAMFGGPQPNISSDLPVLLGGWGVAYDPSMVVGDLENAEEVQLRDESRLRYPVWINLTQQDFNPKALPTAQLETALPWAQRIPDFARRG